MFAWKVLYKYQIYSRYKYQIILFFCRLREGHQCFYLIQAGLLQCSLMLESAGAVYTDCTRRSDHIKPNLVALHWLPVTFTAVFLSLGGSDSCLGLFLTSMSPIAVRDPLVNLDSVTEGELDFAVRAPHLWNPLSFLFKISS